MDFHPIRPPNLTDSTRHHLNELGGQIGWKSIAITLYACLVELVKLSGNPLRLCLVESTRHEADDAQFDQALITGQIGWKSIEMMPGRISRIGWKSIEMMPS